MGALNNQQSLEDLDMSIFGGGLECNIDEVTIQLRSLKINIPFCEVNQSLIWVTVLFSITFQFQRQLFCLLAVNTTRD